MPTCEDVALFHDADGLVVGIVWNVGGAMEERPNAMPAVRPDDLKPVKRYVLCVWV